MNPFARFASGVFATAWELRRKAYAAGLLVARSVPARVVSVGNITVGGTGKTTLVLHLAQRARERSVPFVVVCRRYRPGPGGKGDEELLYEAELGADAVLAGDSKRDLAAQAAERGAELVIVDDGFSHWGLDRDLDVVLIDSQDPWGGGRFLPAGRLREPLRALQRAGLLVLSRVEGEPAQELVEDVQRHAPAATVCAGRHRPTDFRSLSGSSVAAPPRAHLVTATGNPDAFVRTAREVGVETVSRGTYRDHHWFTREEAEQELRTAASSGSTLLLTSKDAVRWPVDVPADGVAVLAVEWEWLHGGERAEAMIFEDVDAAR